MWTGPPFGRAGVRTGALSVRTLPSYVATIVSVLSEPSPARIAGFELGDLLGRSTNVPQLRRLFCPAHGSVPAVLQRKAPLPPLCIMTNQGRQAGRQLAVPLAHHSTASFPWKNKLTELYCYYGCVIRQMDLWGYSLTDGEENPAIVLEKQTASLWY